MPWSYGLQKDYHFFYAAGRGLLTRSGLDAGNDPLERCENGRHDRTGGKP